AKFFIYNLSSDSPAGRRPDPSMLPRWTSGSFTRFEYGHKNMRCWTGSAFDSASRMFHTCFSAGSSTVADWRLARAGHAPRTLSGRCMLETPTHSHYGKGGFGGPNGTFKTGTLGVVAPVFTGGSTGEGTAGGPKAVPSWFAK